MQRALLYEVDATSGATYCTLRDEPVARTVHVSEDVLVDVNDRGEPVGIEFPFRQPQPGEREWHELFGSYPELKEALPQFL